MGFIRRKMQAGKHRESAKFGESQGAEKFLYTAQKNCCNATPAVLYKISLERNTPPSIEDGTTFEDAVMNQQIEFEIPVSVRDLASKSVEQAREAYNRFLEATRQAHDVVAKSADVITSGAKEINEKAVKYTEANLQANFELAQRLVHAKDLKEALDIQSQFARQQMETFAQQAQELSRLVAQSAQKANPSGQI
jgi:phasin